MFISICFISWFILVALVYSYIYNDISIDASSKFSKVFLEITFVFPLFGVIYYSFYEIREIDNSTYNIYVLSIVTTIIILISAYSWKNRVIDPSSKLKSTKKEDVATSPPILKKVSEISNKDISTYPRITIYDYTENNEMKSKPIFDSSDYKVINKIFGTFDNIQQSFIEGGELIFKEKEYITKNVRVDLLSIFDDYSFTRYNLIKNVSKDTLTPYNIQIIVHVSENK